MKTCPRCGASYGDEMSFCLNDGASLLTRQTEELSAGPTEAYGFGTNPADMSLAPTIVSMPAPQAPAPPKQYQMSMVNPATRTGCLITVGQISALFLFVVGLGAAGFYYIYRSQPEVAYRTPSVEDSYTPPERSEPIASNMSPANSTTGDPPRAPKVTTEPAANSIEPKTKPIKAPPSVETEPPPMPPPPSSAPPDLNEEIDQPRIATRSKPPPKTVSAGVLNGKATSLPKPAYPPAARTIRASGSVSVQVLVSESGRVISANAVSGHPLLRAAAASAARNATFAPTLLSGQPVKVSGVITYNFVP